MCWPRDTGLAGGPGDTLAWGGSFGAGEEIFGAGEEDFGASVLLLLGWVRVGALPTPSAASE